MSDEKREPEYKPRSTGIANDIDTRPKNWLVPVTLVMLRQWNSYGYELVERTVELGFETINPGTVYRTLRKMEKDGLCESERETTSSGGPARRMYSITDAGGAYLALWVRSMEQYQQTMDDFSEPISAACLARKQASLDYISLSRNNKKVSTRLVALRAL